VGFQWWCSGDVTRTQNLSEYMLVLTLWLVNIVFTVNARREQKTRDCAYRLTAEMYVHCACMHALFLKGTTVYVTRVSCKVRVMHRALMRSHSNFEFNTDSPDLGKFGPKGHKEHIGATRRIRWNRPCLVTLQKPLNRSRSRL